MKDEPGVQPSKKHHTTAFMWKAIESARQMLKKYFVCKIEFFQHDAVWAILDADTIKSIPDTLGNWRRWPLKENREVTIAATVLDMTHGEPHDVTMRIVVVKFDHPTMPGWVPVFARLWYQAEDYGVDYGCNFEFEFLPIGQCMATPEKIGNWGD